MEIATDILLRGTSWNNVIQKLDDIFVLRPNYSLFVLSASIGIMYDKQIESPLESGETPRNVPRTVILGHMDTMEFLFQTAILTSSYAADKTAEDRMALAFDDKASDFSKVGFLTRFANYGVTKLEELIEAEPLETMENIKTFLVSSMQGTNLDIDDIDDLLSDSLTE